MVNILYCWVNTMEDSQKYYEIEILTRELKEGKEAYVIFVIQMKGVKAFKPNDEKHKAFGDALRHAHKMGVKVWAFECSHVCRAV